MFNLLVNSAFFIFCFLFFVFLEGNVEEAGFVLEFGSLMPVS